VIHKARNRSILGFLRGSLLVYAASGLALFLFPLNGWGQKEIKLEIYPSTDERIPIGIGRFDSRITGSGLSREVSGLIRSVLESDLRFSLYFRIISGEEGSYGTGSAPDRGTGKPALEAWKGRGAKFLVTGSFGQTGERIQLELKVISLWTFKEIARRQFETSIESLRWTIHGMADAVIETAAGEKGVSQTLIAYVSERQGKKGLNVVDYDGYNARPLTVGEEIVMSPAWSPNGKKIVFTSYRDDNPNIYLRDLMNHSDTRLLSFPGINSAPSWSPDGRYLAVTLSKDGASEIYRYDYKSSVLRRLTYNMSIDTSPAWSPNGKQIVFTSDRMGNPHIFIMDSDGSNLRRLTRLNPYNDTPVWSPLGDRIAFVSRERGEQFDVYTLGIMSGKVRQLTAVGNNTHPSWSPDGLHIVFSSNRDGQDEIYTMNWDGTGLKRLTYNGGNTSPAWSPRLTWYKGGEGL
jgi:TolB protein